MAVQLVPLDEPTVERLLAAAEEGARPIDVMPPVDGPPGWHEGTRAAFRAFHHRHLAGAEGTVMYAIESGDDVIGMIRLADLGGGTAETGMWLGSSSRGGGLGTQALRALLVAAAARGVRLVVADTTPDNVAAQRALRRCGARLSEDAGKVQAVFELA